MKNEFEGDVIHLKQSMNIHELNIMATEIAEGFIKLFREGYELAREAETEPERLCLCNYLLGIVNGFTEFYNCCLNNEFMVTPMTEAPMRNTVELCQTHTIDAITKNKFTDLEFPIFVYSMLRKDGDRDEE